MDYTAVRISTLKTKREIPFGVYIFFKERHLLYLKAGTLLSTGKYKILKKQKVSKFFIDTADELKYQAFLENLLNDTLEDEGASLEAKIDVVEGTSQTALEKLNEDPGSKAAFQMTQTAARSISKIVLENPDALKNMFEKEGAESEFIIKHSINVCALCVKLAELKKCTSLEIENLATAALMHDIGFTAANELEKTLFNKPKVELSQSEKDTYYNHIDIGLTLLKNREWINPEIMSLIENHEENLSGTGPLKKTKLTKIEEILSLVNAYDKKIKSQGLTPSQAIKQFMVEEMGNYGMQTIQELAKVVKVSF